MKTTFSSFPATNYQTDECQSRCGSVDAPEARCRRVLGLKITHVMAMVPVSSAEGNPPALRVSLL